MGKNGRRITKSRKKTEKRKPNAEKSSTRGGRCLKKVKSVRKEGKRAENCKETVKKPKRNSKIEQKGRKNSSGQGKNNAKIRQNKAQKE